MSVIGPRKFSPHPRRLCVAWPRLAWLLARLRVPRRTACGLWHAHGPVQRDWGGDGRVCARVDQGNGHNGLQFVHPVYCNESRLGCASLNGGRFGLNLRVALMPLP